ncbi:MAG TPA: poly-gamma-glutamate system protein [bacterium]|nr:poly-gamma-glutamate system protein [bacterium]
MKRLYWRPQRVSLSVLVLVALLSVGGLFLVEHFKIQERQPFYKEKMRAANLALRCFDAVKTERLRRGISIDQGIDPTGSGLIGELLTPVTTNPGHLPSKQTSVNPNFAAVIVYLLIRAGVETGDTVAIGMSGSFPAVNIATLAALETMKIKSIIITSVGSSQWGANNPEFLWPEMHDLLLEKRLITAKPIAISRGGLEDKALGLSKKGRRLIERSIERSGLEYIEAETYADSVQRRMELYQQYSGEEDIQAYINVGGGTASVGARLGRQLFHAGLNKSAPVGADDLNSVMARFIVEDKPVIHLMRMDKLAQRYGLPIQPRIMPRVGEGKIFVKEEPNRMLAVSILLSIVILLLAFGRLDWGYRIMTMGRREPTRTRPEKMV